jgi:hypothetical protein
MDGCSLAASRLHTFTAPSTIRDTQAITLPGGIQHRGCRLACGGRRLLGEPTLIRAGHAFERAWIIRASELLGERHPSLTEDDAPFHSSTCGTAWFLPSTHTKSSRIARMTGFEKRPSIDLNRWVTAAQRMQQRTTGEAVGAQAMRGFVETPASKKTGRNAADCGRQ